MYTLLEGCGSDVVKLSNQCHLCGKTVRHKTLIACEVQGSLISRRRTLTWRLLVKAGFHILSRNR